jgi:hypothetical protein
MPNAENLKGKGFKDRPQNINRKGRPRKYVCSLIKDGYRLSEVNDTIQAMISMNMDELKEVWDNPKATILEKTIANALRKSMDRGQMESIETLLTRLYGKPKEKVELGGDLSITNHVIKLNFTNNATIKDTDSNG